MSIHVAAIGAALLFGAAGQANSESAQPEAQQAGIDTDLALLDELDRVAVSCDYTDVDLSEVAKDLSAKLPASLMLDREGLRAIGVRDDDRVSLQAGPMAASALLDALTRELASGLDQPVWDVHRGTIVLTSEDDTEKLRSLHVYDVRDLVADDSLLGELRATRAAVPGAAQGEAADVGEDEEEADLPVFSRGHELLLIILEHLDPDAWVDMGGSRATITDHEGLVVVSAPSRLHRQFRDALRRLRDAHVHELRLQVQIIDLPRAKLDELSRQFLHDGELAVALPRDRNAIVRWQTLGTVATGSTLSMRSSSDDKMVEIDLKATFDRVTGRLSMDVNATMEDGADKRNATTAVEFQFSEGAAILELPAAEVSNTARVLIVRAI